MELQKLLQSNDLQMMEEALPYISPNLKQPLALYIKLEELHRLMNSFRNKETLSACGFEDYNPNIEQMLRSMRKSADKERAAMIDNMLNMIKLARVLPLLMNVQSGDNGPSSQEEMMNRLLDMMMNQKGNDTLSR
ncbi:MAG: hypothetical protein ACI4CT_07855 [Lachnospiraceae bacterium]